MGCFGNLFERTYDSFQPKFTSSVLAESSPLSMKVKIFCKKMEVTERSVKHFIQSQVPASGIL